MPSYQINIQRDEIFIENENELSHNSLKLLRLTLVNGGEVAHVRITPGPRPIRYQLCDTLLNHENIAIYPPA